MLRRTGGRVPSALVRIVPQLGDDRDDLAQMRLDPEAERYAFFEGVVDLLASASAERPLLMVIDDLQWAAEPTLLLLRHLLRSSRPTAMLVVATYRHTEVGRQHPLAALLADLRRESGVERIGLRGLDVEEVVSLVRAAADHDLDERALRFAETLQAETEGNPLFIIEVLRHLVDIGLLYASGDGWTSDVATIHELDLPESIRDLIGRRLTRLADATNAALKVASVIGPTFSPSLVARAGEAPPDLDGVLDALDEATVAGLLVETGSDYAFAHDLIRQVVSSEMSATRRARLHLRVGQAIESLPDGRGYLASLAYHFAEARDAGKAAEYARLAALHAIDHLAFEEAIGLLERGLEVVDAGGAPNRALRADLLVVMARALERMNEMTRVREVALRAIEDARAVGAPELMARAALLLLSEGIVTVGSQDPAPATAGEQAIAALADGSPGLRARLLSGLARHAVLARGDVPRAAELAEKAWALASDSGDEPAIGAALMARGLALEGSPQVDERLALYDELVNRTEHSDAVLLSQGRSLRMRANLERGDLVAVDADVAALEYGDAQPWWYSRAVVAIQRASRALLLGQLDDVEDLINEALAHGGKDLDVSNGCMGQLFFLRRDQGRVDELVSFMAHGVEVDPSFTVYRVGLTVAQAELGALDEARAHFDVLAHDNFDHLPRDSTWTASLAMMSEVAAVLEDSTRAMTLYDLFTPYAGLFVILAGTGVCLGAVDRHLGMLAAATGRHAEAAEHYRTALAMEESLDAPPLVARTRFWFACALMNASANEDSGSARELLRLAADDAEALGLSALADDALTRLAVISQ